MKLFLIPILAATLLLPATSLFAAGEASSVPAATEAVAPVKPRLPDLVKGEASFNAVCVACHGTAGNSSTPAYPKLSQQHPEYLVNQLKAYKSGERKNAIMAGFAAGLSEDDMKDISYWVASQKSKPGFSKDKELVSLGERIYRGGVSDRQIAACAGCHSPNGAGIPSQYPRLAGQHAEYVSTQLNAYRVGSRKNVQMNMVAAKLNDREISALADYVAGLR
jgi:cytochrome c553